MTEAPATPDLAEQQKKATAFLGSMLNSGAEPLLKAQADLLVSVESTMNEWLHRRHEALTEAQNLVARLRSNTDPSEMLKAQQEWVTGAFRRLAADAAAYQTATLQLVDRARNWIEPLTEAAQSVAQQADAAVQAASKSVRKAAE